MVCILPHKSNAGITPIQIMLWILALGIILFLIWLLFSAAPTPAINKQRPSAITLQGPNLLGGTDSVYTATVTLTEPLANSDQTIEVQIWEHDVFVFGGDTIIDKEVTVTIKGDETSGSATFTLNCRGRKLHGEDGTDDDEDGWEVYGYTPDQATAKSKSGNNLDISCAEDVLVDEKE